MKNRCKFAADTALFVFKTASMLHIYLKYPSIKYLKWCGDVFTVKEETLSKTEMANTHQLEMEKALERVGE